MLNKPTAELKSILLHFPEFVIASREFPENVKHIAAEMANACVRYGFVMYDWDADCGEVVIGMRTDFFTIMVYGSPEHPDTPYQAFYVPESIMSQRLSENMRAVIGTVYHKTIQAALIDLDRIAASRQRGG